LPKNFENGDVIDNIDFLMHKVFFAMDILSMLFDFKFLTIKKYLFS